MSKYLPLSFVLLSCISSLQAAEQPKPMATEETPAVPSTFTGKITGNRVRLRANADLDSKIIKEFSKDDLVLVTGEKNGFYAVEPVKGTKGYLFRSYVLDNVVEASKVNVRLEPSTEASIVTQLETGTHVDGTISKLNSKWLEIDLPKEARFYVAKEYVESVGRPELFETIQKRKVEVTQALSDACALSQTEMRKPFEQINIELIKSNFNHIVENYSDFKEQQAKAKEFSNLIQETYLQNKIAYLESKNKETSQEYEKRLASLECKLQKEQIQPVGSELKQEDAVLPSQATLAQNTLPCNVWESVEDRLFTAWARANNGQNKKEFYQAQLPSAVVLKGVIERYNVMVQNRPGDFVLKVNGMPVAFIYSTCIDLNERVGKEVTVSGLRRPNNHFAYPAYYAISMQ